MTTESIKLKTFDILSDVKSLISSVITRWEDNRKINATYNELSALTDKELKDIGICRGDIRGIAMGMSPSRNGW